MAKSLAAASTLPAFNYIATQTSGTRIFTVKGK
jgi:hypothetical protein